MTKFKKQFIPWVPRKPMKIDFPFSYKLNEYYNADVPYEHIVQYTDGDDLLGLIRMYLIKVFPFYLYYDENSPQFLGKEVSGQSLFFDIKIDHFTYMYDPIKKDKKGNPQKKKVSAENWYIRVHSFQSDYTFNLVRSLEQLTSILDGAQEIAFDTETTGLNPEIDYITGISLSTKDKQGFYVPIRHNKMFEQYNLGTPAIEIIYNAFLKALVIYMFNSRFDMRMMEYTDDIFDLSGIKMLDVQLNASYADPDMKERSLKGLEKWFLGYHRLDLDDTLNSLGVDSYDTSLIDPRNILFYAAQDAISTLELAHETNEYYEEFGLSAQIDQALLYPLMKMENRPIRVDLEEGEKASTTIKENIERLGNLLRKEIGDVNLNSPPQKVALFKSFKLDTGVKTDTGEMSTGAKAITDMIDRLKKEGKKYPQWLEYLNEYSKYGKLSNTFFGPVLEYAKQSGGKVRFNYRHGNTTTGRLSSGEEE